ncbi:uncharacterized protein LOC122277023 [Carya illinoinensis]|uniref:uncharacterized protein LOC122277023 n=1 Tax=Carya illinoinensis TaxID=32201 RepID=UPI001C72454E|nr:uncharacterized protein LOC122277023 [Carya illinoinensis]
MEEDLARQWEGLCFTEKEKEGLVLPAKVLHSALHYGKYCLLAMIVSEKFINKEAFKVTMTKIWKCDSWVQFTEVGSNKFLIEFNLEEDMKRVIAGRPWSFDRWLICLQPFDSSKSIGETTFTKEEFWVQVFNMPFGCMTREIGMQVGNNVGKVVKVHVDQRGIGWGKFLRIRVEIDITKPLLRGIFISVEGKQTWIQLRYERLPSFCFNCGTIKHTTQGCILSRNEEKQQYGAWLRAAAPRESDLLFKKYGNDMNPEAEPERQSWRKKEEVRDEVQSRQHSSQKVDQKLTREVTDPRLATATPTAKGPEQSR